MNFQESEKILQEIKKADSILINCHRNPDPDSVGSALAMYWELSKLGKKVSIISPTKINYNLEFLPNFKKIQIVDFSTFDFSEHDLFFCLDSSSWDMVLGSNTLEQPKIPVVVIDHHKTKSNYGKINLLKDKIPSTGEMLYLLFSDWKLKLDKTSASCLLCAIIGDTGAFRFPNLNSDVQTLQIAADLIELGANKTEIVQNLFRTTEPVLLRFWGKVLKEMKVDQKARFVWSAISLEEYLSLGKLAIGKETAASQFFQIVSGTDFGLLMVEEEKNTLSISLRSRTGFDTSKIALELGGGGHIYASGAKIQGLPFAEAVQKVLETARKYAKK
jgi:phosphoesterase RecJ-like protein